MFGGVKQSSVSIHAPTGGATIANQTGTNQVLFQFTRPRGARPRTPAACLANRRFNSRAHGGRDTRRVARTARPCAFQFTRPRGARRASPIWETGACGFQFTRPRGARRWRLGRPAPPLRFNSRAHGGRDLHNPDGSLTNPVSIHAPTGGATRLHGDADGEPAFQFTRPRGARLSPCICAL